MAGASVVHNGPAPTTTWPCPSTSKVRPGWRPSVGTATSLSSRRASCRTRTAPRYRRHQHPLGPLAGCRARRIDFGERRTRRRAAYVCDHARARDAELQCLDHLLGLVPQARGVLTIPPIDSGTVAAKWSSAHAVQSRASRTVAITAIAAKSGSGPKTATTAIAALAPKLGQRGV
jgi:hypothetical protein